MNYNSLWNSADLWGDFNPCRSSQPSLDSVKLIGSKRFNWIKSLESVSSKGLMTYVVSGHSDDGSNKLKKFCGLLVIASIHFRKFRVYHRLLIKWIQQAQSISISYVHPVWLLSICCVRQLSIKVIQLNLSLCDPNGIQLDPSLIDWIYPNAIYIIEFRHFFRSFPLFCQSREPKGSLNWLIRLASN